jgi:ribosomal protein L35
MPKMKTHRGLAKRVKRTGGGGLKRYRAFTSHRFNYVVQEWYQKATTNVSVNN